MDKGQATQDFCFLDRHVKSIRSQLAALHWLSQSLPISERIPMDWFHKVDKENKYQLSISKPETLLVIKKCPKETFRFIESILSKSQYDFGMFKNSRFVKNEERPNHSKIISFDNGIYDLEPGIHRVEIELFGNNDSSNIPPAGLEALCFFAFHPVIFRNVGDILPECELTGIFCGNKKITTKWSEEHHGPHFIVQDSKPTNKLIAKPTRIKIAA